MMVVEFAVPPSLTDSQPPELTIVPVAMPPLETIRPPPELTMV